MFAGRPTPFAWVDTPHLEEAAVPYEARNHLKARQPARRDKEAQ
jgi:hypothetical protein